MFILLSVKETSFNMVSRITLLLVLCQIAAIAIANPVNPKADEKTRKVYWLLKGLPWKDGRSLLSGAFGGYTRVTNEDGFGMYQADQIFKSTSKYPAIYAIDCARGWETKAPWHESEALECGINDDAVKYWNRGGLLTLSHHLPNPFYPGGGNLKKQISNDEYAQILRPGTEPRLRWTKIMDKIAAGLKEYQNRGITILYRPLHEMNGDWFWWGATGYNTKDTVRMDLYKKLYRDMYNYFTFNKGLNNLLWVWSPDANRGYKSWYYPGGDIVDVTALDMYIDNPDKLEGYGEMVGLNKIFAFAEAGPQTTNGQFNFEWLVNSITSKYPKAAYFVPWNNNWSPIKNQKAWQAYNHPKVLNLGNFKL